MRKSFITFLLLFPGLGCFAQIERRSDVMLSVASADAFYISLECYDIKDKEKVDAHAFALPKNGAGLGLDSVSIVITSKKVRDTLFTGGHNMAGTEKYFRSNKLHFVVSRRGYETLEQDFNLNSNMEMLRIFLKKKENE